jgi:hypothetical protein
MGAERGTEREPIPRWRVLRARNGRAPRRATSLSEPVLFGRLSLCRIRAQELPHPAADFHLTAAPRSNSTAKYSLRSLFGGSIKRLPRGYSPALPFRIRRASAAEASTWCSGSWLRSGPFLLLRRLGGLLLGPAPFLGGSNACASIGAQNPLLTGTIAETGSGDPGPACAL